MSTTAEPPEHGSTGRESDDRKTEQPSEDDLRYGAVDPAIGKRRDSEPDQPDQGDAGQGTQVREAAKPPAKDRSSAKRDDH